MPSTWTSFVVEECGRRGWNWVVIGRMANSAPPLPPGAHLKKIDTNDGRHVGVVDVVDIVDAF